MSWTKRSENSWPLPSGYIDPCIDDTAGQCLEIWQDIILPVLFLSISCTDHRFVFTQHYFFCTHNNLYKSRFVLSMNIYYRNIYSVSIFIYIVYICIYTILFLYKSSWQPFKYFHSTRPLGQAELLYWCLFCVCVHVCPPPQKHGPLGTL